MVPVSACRYVCLGSSPSPAPADASYGFVCPPGHSCPVGSSGATPCEPGSYSSAPGASDCAVCPPGSTCSSSATQQPLICPAGEKNLLEGGEPSNQSLPSLIPKPFTGHFCPAGTSRPEPCPLGTLGAQTGAHALSACTPCSSGVFCGTEGASAPQGTNTDRTGLVGLVCTPELFKRVGTSVGLIREDCQKGLKHPQQNVQDCHTLTHQQTPLCTVPACTCHLDCSSTT